MSERTFTWFSSLAEVLEVNWSNPEGVVPDPRLAAAHPVSDPDSYSPIGIAWVGNDGRPIGDGYVRDRSPAELLLDGRYEIEDSNKAILTMCHALALPGTRSDYHQALSWLPNVASVPGAWIESVLRADVQLVLSDPVGTLTSPRRGDGHADRELKRASAPVLRLMRLYLNEGFLREAAEVERLLERLPEEARSPYDYAPGPSQVADGLSELAR